MTTEIPLTQGQVALVNDEHGHLVAERRWYAVWDEKGQTFYAETMEPTNSVSGPRQRKVKMHRLVLGLEPCDQYQGDHRNHNGLDNRVGINLRIATKRQQHLNQRPRGHSSFKGVGWHPRTQKWAAFIGTGGGDRKHLGYFASEEDAARAYDEACCLLLSEEDLPFAYLNFPEGP